MKYILAILFTFSILSISYAGATKPGDYQVSAGKLNVRLAADKNGKVIKKVYRGQSIEVFEIKGEWARISDFYDGADDGVPGNVAHWVAARYLSNNRPVKVAKVITKTNSSVTKAIKFSDDFSRHQNVFISASEKLINDGGCKIADFKKMGGWWRSLTHKPEPVYVTYCGGSTKNNRIYLNVLTGATFK